MRILVTGSRDYPYWNTVNEALLKATPLARDLTIVHGDCPTGADALAQRWCDYQLDGRSEKHPADWGQHGKRAGFVRNAEMVNSGINLCFGFLMPCRSTTCRRTRPHMSHGGQMTVDLALSADITTILYHGQHQVIG